VVKIIKDNGTDNYLEGKKNDVGKHLKQENDKHFRTANKLQSIYQVCKNIT